MSAAAARCERCGASFGCEAGTGRDCWCAAVELDDATRAALAARHERCLCPDCLTAAARGATRAAAGS
ncbi:MAG: Cysteine-rich [Thermoleophilaceae bacterium]|nr:Cysteine-rich [Thermoleophilaceae bacterium]